MLGYIGVSIYGLEDASFFPSNEPLMAGLLDQFTEVIRWANSKHLERHTHSFASDQLRLDKMEACVIHYNLNVCDLVLVSKGGAVAAAKK